MRVAFAAGEGRKSDMCISKKKEEEGGGKPNAGVILGRIHKNNGYSILQHL